MKEKTTVAKRIAQIGLWVIVALVMFAVLLVSAQVASTSVRAESVAAMEKQIESGQIQDLLDKGIITSKETKEEVVPTPKESLKEVSLHIR